MNRREFIKLIGATGVGMSIPDVLKNAVGSPFNPFAVPIKGRHLFLHTANNPDVYDLKFSINGIDTDFAMREVSRTGKWVVHEVVLLQEPNSDGCTETVAATAETSGICDSDFIIKHGVGYA